MRICLTSLLVGCVAALCLMDPVSGAPFFLPSGGFQVPDIASMPGRAMRSFDGFMSGLSRQGENFMNAMGAAGARFGNGITNFDPNRVINSLMPNFAVPSVNGIPGVGR